MVLQPVTGGPVVGGGWSMDLSLILLAAAGGTFVGTLPLSMAWVERTLMTGPTRTEQLDE